MPRVGENRFLSDDIAKKACAPIRWMVFDAPWYRRRYHDVLSDQERHADDQTLQSVWQREGVQKGRSPNRFFDEKWYLHHNGDVLRGIQLKGIFESGYQHYADIGYRSCSPHWLFDQEYYLRTNTHISLRYVYKAGFKNIYDFFLKVGDGAKENPHLFFNQEIFSHECLKDGVEYDFSRGGFEQYLALSPSQIARVRTSWYFDPKWYLSRYPHVEALIESGQYVTPLHHYLDNEHAQDFDPNPFFSEQYYSERYPDVREAIEKGIFRNGYAHFIASGVYEHRQPHEDVDLAHFVTSQDVDRLCALASVPDVFALWCKRHEDNLPAVPDDAQKESYQKLAFGHIEAALPAIFRSPLSFSRDPHASVSVILLSEGDYVSVAGSLLALHQQLTTVHEIIIVSNGNAIEQKRIRSFAHGITLVHPEEILSETSLLTVGLEHAQTDHVVVLRAGMQLAPGGLTVIDRTLRDGHCDGGTGQIVGADGYIREAGCHLWRDGSVTLKSVGQRVSEGDAGTDSPLDITQSGFFFGKRDALLKAMPRIASCGFAMGFAPLVLALRSHGMVTRYCAGVIVRDVSVGNAAPVDHKHQALLVRRHFAHVVMRHPLPGSGAVYVRRDQPSVVMVFHHFPRSSEGGASRRILRQVDAFHRCGWHVTVAGLHQGDDDVLTMARDYPATVTCIHKIDDVASFVEKYCQSSRLLWVNGTATLSVLSPFITKGEVENAGGAILLDTVTHDGGGLRAMESHLRRLVGADDDQDRLMREAEAELADAWMCHSILAADEEECHLIRRLGFGHVRVLPPVVQNELRTGPETPEFYRRQGLLFPLSIFRSGDAAHDGFDWFCLHVMPHVKAALGEDVPLWIGGYHHPSVDLGFYERFAALEGLTHPAPYEELMKQCRVLIAPTRLLVAESTEVVEGASYGLPSVMSSPLLKGLHWTDRQDALDGGFNDPKRFADAVIELYRREALWSKVQSTIEKRVKREHHPDVFVKAFTDIVADALGETPSAQEASFFENPPRKKRFAPPPLRLKPAPVSAQVDGPTLSEHEESDDENDDAPLQTRLGVELSQ